MVRRAPQVLALHADMADLVRLGAYRAGTDPAVDEALRLAPAIEAMLAQRKDEPVIPTDAAFRALAAVMDGVANGV